MDDENECGNFGPFFCSGPFSKENFCSSFFCFLIFESYENEFWNGAHDGVYHENYKINMPKWRVFCIFL